MARLYADEQFPRRRPQTPGLRLYKLALGMIALCNKKLRFFLIFITDRSLNQG